MQKLSAYTGDDDSATMDVLQDAADAFALTFEKDEKEKLKSRITMLLLQIAHFANHIEATLSDTSMYDTMLEKYLERDSDDVCPLLSELEDLHFTMKAAMQKRDEYMGVKTVRFVPTDPTLRSRTQDSLEGQTPSITDVTEDIDEDFSEHDETEAIMKAIEEQELREALAQSEGPADPNRIYHA